MIRWLGITAGSLGAVAAGLAIVVFAPGSSSAQSGDERPTATLWAGGIGVSLSYVMICEPGEQAFSIEVSVAQANSANGLIATGEGSFVFECGDEEPASFQVFSDNDVAFTTGAFGGSQRICFGTPVSETEVTCDRGGGGLMEGKVTR